MSERYLSIAEEIKQQRPFASPSQEAVVALLRTASLLEHRAEQLVKPAGLTQQQFNVLRILRGAGEALPTMAVADRLVQPTPGVTRLLGRLEAQGHIERVRSDSDRRQILVRITEAGRAALADSDPRMARLDACLDEHCAVEELQTLTHLLAKVRHLLREAEAEAAVGD